MIFRLMKKNFRTILILRYNEILVSISQYNKKSDFNTNLNLYNLRSPQCHNATLPHCNIATLPHCNIATVLP